MKTRRATARKATIYVPNDKFIINGHTNLYAVWEEYPKFTVEYKDGYADGTFTEPEPYYIEEKGSEPVTVRENMFERPGYDFANWSVSFGKSKAAAIAYPNDVLNGITHDVTLTAQWTPKEYAIFYELDGGTVYGVNPTQYTAETPTFTLIAPEKPGYQFTGWIGTGIEGAKTNVAIPQGSIGERAYTATWKKDVAQWTKIIFESSDPAAGSLKGTTSYEGIKGMAIDGIEYPAPMPENGYEFAGWDAVIPENYPEENLIIHALWKNAAGGGGEDPEPSVSPTSPPKDGETQIENGEKMRGGQPKTNDNRNVITWVIVAGSALAAIGVLIYRKIKK